MRGLVLTLSLLLSLAAPARSDDVTDQVNEALTAYGKKDVPTAILGLEAALALLRQSRADSYGKMLPAAPGGWTADKTETIALGGPMAAIGTGVTQKYRKGAQTVTVSILADSPMMQMVVGLASSGFAAAAGVRTTIVGGRRMMYMNNDNAYMSVVADRVLVRVEGEHGTDEAVLKQFMTLVDFAGIEKLGK